MKNEIKQAIDYINKSNRILIALPQSPNGDALGSGLALYQVLKNLNKQPELVCAAQKIPSYQFLKGISEIAGRLATYQSFVISVNTAGARLDELSYETRDDRVDIFLKPKSGVFTKEDISFRSGQFPYDLVITLDAPALENLGAIYDQNTDLFFETTVINIDHNPGNAQYGEINLVDPTATSTAEILTELILEFEENLLDRTIATGLLTGIIVETNSFQHIKTTPRAFLRASDLVSAGADQQQIVRELYKTKNISQLKLWGRALARIRQAPELGLTYSLLARADIDKSGAAPDDIYGVMKELVASMADARIIILLAETKDGQVEGFFNLHSGVKAQVVASTLGGQMLNGSFGRFALAGKSILEAEKEMLARMQRLRGQIPV